LFTVLSLIKGANVFLKVIYSLTYWVLWFAGLYSLLNFRNFASEAEIIRTFVYKYKEPMLNRMKSEIKKESTTPPNIIYRNIQKAFSWFKRWEKKLDALIALYFLFVGILPWIFTLSL